MNNSMVHYPDSTFVPSSVKNNTIDFKLTSLHMSIKRLTYINTVILAMLILFAVLYPLNVIFEHNTPIYMWIYVSLMVVFVNSMVQFFLIKSPRLLNIKHIPFFQRYLVFHALMFGSFLLIGAYACNINEQFFLDPQPTAQNTIFWSMYLSCFLLAITFLSVYIRAFIAFFCISTSFIFFYQLTGSTENLLKPTYLCMDLFLFTALICAIYTKRSNQRFTILSLINKQNLIDREHDFHALREINSELALEVNNHIHTHNELLIAQQALKQQLSQKNISTDLIHTELQHSQESLVLIYHIADIATWDWNIPAQYINMTNSVPVTSYTSEELSQFIAMPAQIIKAEHVLLLKNSLIAHFKGETAQHDVQYQIKNKAGEWLWMHDIGRVIERDPVTHRATRMLGIRRNIHTEKKLNDQMKRSADVFKQASQGFFVMNDSFHFLEINPCFTQLTGFTEAMIGQHFNITKLFHLQHNRDKFYQDIFKALMRDGEYDGETTTMTADGREIPIWIHISAVADQSHDAGTKKTSHYIGIMSDISQRKIAERQVNYLANYDPITDLPNRNLLKNKLNQMMSQPSELDQEFTILHINIDRFKVINEALGNEKADELLKQFSDLLVSFDPQAFIVSRLGADNFIVGLRVSTYHTHLGLKNYAERLMAFLNTPFHIENQTFNISVSIGMAIYPEHSQHVEALLTSAENAMVSAKQEDESSAHFFSPSLKTTQVRRIDLLSDLHKAIHNNELTVYYQPKTNLKNHEFVGFEALARWTHPTKGLIGPFDFIPLAAENGMICKLGEVIFEQTCAQLRLWNDMGFYSFKISINVVAQQIRRTGFVDFIDQMLVKYNVNPENIELEITESSLLSDSPEVSAFFEAMKARRIDIALDDFGTGYSSLSYLSQYPLDTLKIDKAFIDCIGKNKSQEAIVIAILAMGHSLGMVVVAEGIESYHQMQFLQKAECDVMQGYFLSRPMPSPQATHFLEVMRQDDDGKLFWNLEEHMHTLSQMAIND